MTRRLLLGWTVAGLVMACTPAMAKPPELPTNPINDGKVPTPMEQDHFQVAKTVEPRLLPISILELKPAKYEPPTATVSTTAQPADSGILLVAWIATEPARQHVRAKEAFDTAEKLFKSCESLEARKWYQTVVALSPGSEVAQIAEKRLSQTTVARFGDIQTGEPPFADKEVPAEVIAVQLKVLREAARQYREAVANGNKKQIEETERTLDAVLRQTKAGK